MIIYSKLSLKNLNIIYMTLLKLTLLTFTALSKNNNLSYYHPTTNTLNSIMILISNNIIVMI